MDLDHAPRFIRAGVARSASRIPNDPFARRLRAAIEALFASCDSGHPPRSWRASFDARQPTDALLDEALAAALAVAESDLGAILDGMTGTLAHDVIGLDVLIRLRRRLPAEWAHPTTSSRAAS